MITSAPPATSPSQPKPKPAKRVRRSNSQWKALLEEFNTSGLTKTAFCEKHRIATSNLYRWQHLLSHETGDTGFIDITEPLSISPVPPTPTDHDRDNNWQVELVLGAGIVLRVRTL